MANPYITSLIGLMGAVIGATASLLGSSLNEQRKARFDRREKALSIISEAVISGDRTKITESKVWIAITAERSSIRRLASEGTAAERLFQLMQIVLDIVNAERSSMKLEKLDLKDISTLLVAKEHRGSMPTDGDAS